MSTIANAAKMMWETRRNDFVQQRINKLVTSFFVDASNKELLKSSDIAVVEVEYEFKRLIISDKDRTAYLAISEDRDDKLYVVLVENEDEEWTRKSDDIYSLVELGQLLDKLLKESD